jgi:predicted secreted protein
MKTFPTIINHEDNLHTFTIPEGTTFSIELPENGTTGYQWTSPSFDNTVLNLESETFVSNCDESTAGCGGKKRLNFIGTNKGISSVLTAHKRLWEKNVLPIDVFSISIRII